MQIQKDEIGEQPKPIGADFFDRFWAKSFTCIKTVADVMREPILILDKDLHVMAANEMFYRTFHVKAEDTEETLVYELGDGQWNIPSLRRLLEDILVDDTFFKGFQVAHEFPSIGRKVMILNARQIYIKDDVAGEEFPPIILLAIEDVTEMMVVAETLANHAKQIEAKLTERAQRLEKQVTNLEQEISALKKKP